MTDALSCDGLVKTYGDVRAVDGLSLHVPKAQCFGLLGPNGAGKTTTIEILEGLTEPTAGEVRVLGLTWARGAPALRERIGICLQETKLEDKLTVRETLALFRSFYRRGQSVEAVIAEMSLGEKTNVWVGKLSGGQRQRLALGCALVGDPELLFLDEPTTGLDPQSRRQIWDLLSRWKTLGRTILISTHYMEEAEQLCDRVAVLDKGRIIAEGTPAELIRSLGGEHVVEFSVRDRPGAPSTEALSTLPSVRAVREGAGATQLTVGEPHVAIPALLALLAAREVELAQLSTRHASLDDVFLSLTGRELRDG